MQQTFAPRSSTFGEDNNQTYSRSGRCKRLQVPRCPVISLHYWFLSFFQFSLYSLLWRFKIRDAWRLQVITEHVWHLSNAPTEMAFPVDLVLAASESAAFVSHVLIDFTFIFRTFSLKFICPLIPVLSTCGESIRENSTYFVNNNYPQPYDGTGSCQLTIHKSNPDICQFRLDFDQFHIGGPDHIHHVCNNDQFIVSGGNPIPGICGMNNGNHS